MNPSEFPEVLPIPQALPAPPVPSLSVVVVEQATLVEEVLPPVEEAEHAELIEEALPLEPVRPTAARKPPDAVLLHGLRATAGWLWRWLVGATLCFTGVFVLSYFTAVVVVGWTYRWMQAVVLRGWWRRSPLRQQMSFREFCDTLGPDGPVPRPRFFWRERIGEVLRRPGPGGLPAGPLRQLGRVLSVPLGSFWRNARLGAEALLCDALLLGWGCLFMLAGWEFGWLNSFHKGYEQSGYGAVFYFTGGVLLIAALFYVPMAQVHQAATGQARAFFEFRFVWRLIRARLGAYVGLAALIVFASLVFMGIRLNAFAEHFTPNRADLSPQQALQAFREEFWRWSLFVLFPLLLLLRWVAAVIYRSAVLKALRRGTVTHGELHPVLARWFDKLQLTIVPTAAPIGVGWWARLTVRWAVHRILFTLLFLVWVVYFARVFVSYFLVADPMVGFLNHPLIELPCFDLIPQHLYFGRNE